MLDPARALIYTMVVVSASDANMTDAELHQIGETVRFLPVFKEVKVDDLIPIARECTDILQDEEGLETVIGLVKATLSPQLRETAYMLACEVVAADGRATREELRMLELLRHGLDIDRLVAAALERGARARHVVA